MSTFSSTTSSPASLVIPYLEVRHEIDLLLSRRAIAIALRRPGARVFGSLRSQGWLPRQIAAGSRAHLVYAGTGAGLQLHQGLRLQQQPGGQKRFAGRRQGQDPPDRLSEFA